MCGDRLFPVVPNDRTSGNGHRLKCMKSPLNMRKNLFTAWVIEHCTGCRELVGSLLGDPQNLSRHSPGQPALGVLA